MTLVKLSDEKARRLAAKFGVDPDSMLSAWHRGDRKHLIFSMKDGSAVTVETRKESAPSAQSNQV